MGRYTPERSTVHYSPRTRSGTRRTGRLCPSSVRPRTRYWNPFRTEETGVTDVSAGRGSRQGPSGVGTGRLLQENDRLNPTRGRSRGRMETRPPLNKQQGCRRVGDGGRRGSTGVSRHPLRPAPPSRWVCTQDPDLDPPKPPLFQTPWGLQNPSSHAHNPTPTPLRGGSRGGSKRL